MQKRSLESRNDLGPFEKGRQRTFDLRWERPKKTFRRSRLNEENVYSLYLGTSMDFWTKLKINWIMFWDWPYTDSWTEDYKPSFTERGWPDPSTTPESLLDKDILELEKIWPTCHPAWSELTLRKTSTSPPRVLWEGVDQEEIKEDLWRETTTRRPKKNDQI